MRVVRIWVQKIFLTFSLKFRIKNKMQLNLKPENAHESSKNLGSILGSFSIKIFRLKVQNPYIYIRVFEPKSPKPKNALCS